jgi:hypothetical protein
VKTVCNTSLQLYNQVESRIIYKYISRILGADEEFEKFKEQLEGGYGGLSLGS